MKPTVLVVLGTRPEAVKLAPVLRALRAPGSGLRARLCATGQHRGLLDQVLRVFGLRPDHDLALMRPGQSPDEVLERALRGLRGVLARERPELLLVQGDTTTALAGGIAAFLRGVPTAHVEAGLRTGDLANPYPEEFNRALLDRFCALRFAPTPRAAQNLRAEGLGGALVTGNTAVDAARWAAAPGRRARVRALEGLPAGARLVLVTLHRRESFGAPLRSVLLGLRELVRRHPEAWLLYPVHPNPRVRGPARALLRHPRALLTRPLAYPELMAAVTRCRFLVTDSGGLQEEAPSLGKPVLVARERTERPELIACGGGRLVGTDGARVLREASRLLRDDAALRSMAGAPNPFGDGRAGERIVAAIRHYFGLGPAPRPWRGPAPR